MPDMQTCTSLFQDKEDDNFLDVNVYVDTLLKSIFKNIGKRKIILMCFSPVIVQLYVNYTF